MRKSIKIRANLFIITFVQIEFFKLIKFKSKCLVIVCSI